MKDNQSNLKKLDVVPHKLQKLNYDKELSDFNMASSDPDDRLATKVVLSDYDWMEYEFNTYFPTRLQGELDVRCMYSGTAKCHMFVEQHLGEKIYSHSMFFSSELFKEFIVDFLKKHIESWNSEYAFCGEKEAVEFFNTILDNAQGYKIEENLDA